MQNTTSNSQINVMHLMITNACDHSCPMCCNKLYNIDEIPVPTVKELKTVNTVCITGGEPFLIKNVANDIANAIRVHYPNVKNIYVYTSGTALYKYLQAGCDIDGFDGITICPKNSNDWDNVLAMLWEYQDWFKELKSNRLYYFTNDKIGKEIIKTNEIKGFKIIERYWDPVFKTPNDEIFRRLPIFYV